MTDRQRKIDAITDSMYYYMVELVSLASDLESVQLDKDGENLRSIADDLERLAIRIIDRQKHRKRSA